MPIKPSQVFALLRQKRDDFKQFDVEAMRLVQQYRSALERSSQASSEVLAEQLQRAIASNPGATILEPFEALPNWVLPANLRWQNRQESLAWVRDRLTGIATFAVDGSQIFPSKDWSIPVALVQIGWFENLHLPSGQYTKDIALDVMTPAELKANNSGEPVDRRVNMRRFEMETERLVRYMEEKAHCEECLVFFDGALIASFADTFDGETRDFYVQCLLKLLRTSEACRVPLVGYIDTSYARDLTLMLQRLHQLPEAQAVHDAQLFHRNMEWGDRTPLFLSQRSGILSEYQEQAHQIAFTYLKTTHDGYPARLEIPLWVYEAGWLDRVMDWVRGEVIIGSGYPYVIETADQTAVLQSSDRQMFLRILQDWAEQENLNLRLSRKMVSKVRRR